jgi:hypothetical protein
VADVTAYLTRLDREVDDTVAPEVWPVYDAVFSDQPDQDASADPLEPARR